MIKTRPMNAEEFYEEFKETIKFLGLNWGEKEKISVGLEDREEGSKFTMSYGGRSAMFQCTIVELIQEKE